MDLLHELMARGDFYQFIVMEHKLTICSLASSHIAQKLHYQATLHFPQHYGFERGINLN